MFHVSSVFIRYFLIGDVILVVDSPYLYRPVIDMAVNGEFFFFLSFFWGSISKLGQNKSCSS